MTNVTERFPHEAREILMSRGHFPTDEAASMLLYLPLRNILSKWKRGNHA